METLRMQLGERRMVSVLVEIAGSDNFEIREASYSLTLNGEEADSGTPNIDDHEMIVYVEPHEVGRYRLKVTFCVGDERIVRDAYIDVMK